MSPEPCVPSVPQIFVEIERARLTRRLAAIREAEGNINDAADTMQEVPVVRITRRLRFADTYDVRGDSS